MAEILYHKRISEHFYLMSVRCGDPVKHGQFYMLRAWESYPVLSRPISVYDADDESVTFLYSLVGEGTELLSRLKAGDEITLQGPYGNGFPAVTGKIALVGGGVGIAPLYLAAKRIRQSGCVVDCFLGFRDEAILVDAYEAVSDKLTVDVGGFITDKIEPQDYDFIFTCGPEVMMRALYAKCVSQNVVERLWVSTESRMACGIGACLVCSCKTTNGNRKVCKDGPVFAAAEVFSI